METRPRLISGCLSNIADFARVLGIVRFFHPSDEAASADWDKIALIGIEQVESTRGSVELAGVLNRIFQPVAPSFIAWASGDVLPSPSAARPVYATKAVRWQHYGPGNLKNESVASYRSTREDASEVKPDDVLIVELKGGVSARIPLALWRRSDGATLPKATVPMMALSKPAGFIPSGFDRPTRLAAVASLWSMLQHFILISMWSRLIGIVNSKLLCVRRR